MTPSRSLASRSSSLLAALCLALAASPATAQEASGPSLEALEEAFGADGTVVLPHGALLRLLDPKPTVGPPQPEAPREFVLLGATLRCEVGEDSARVEALLDLEVRGGAGWVVIPLGAPEAALTEVVSVDERGGTRALAVGAIEDLTARASARVREGLPAKGHAALLPAGAGRVRVRVRGALPVASRPGEATLRLTVPPAALTRLELSGLPSGAIVVGALAERAEAGGQRVAFYAAGGVAEIGWNPRPRATAAAPREAPREPLLSAETETSHRLDEGALETVTRIEYRVLQAPCARFVLRFPQGSTLLAVEGQGVLRLPTAEPDGEGWQRATVELRHAVSGRYTLRVRLETLLPEGAETLEAPRVETVGTERESGLIAARGSAELSLEPSEARGLAQVSLRRLPDPVADALGWERGEDDPPLAYRYLRRPWGLALRVRPIEPELEGEVHTLALVRDDEVGLATTIRYTVRKRGVFGVRLRLPAGYQLQEFADEKAIKDHRIERLPGGGEVLAVDFEKQVPVGSFTLGLFGAVRRTPQPESGAVELELPRVGLEGVVRETGVLAVAALSHLELVRKDARALWAIPVQELAEQGFPYGVGRGEELSFGFRYGAATPELAATFSVSKREPKVGARLETLVDAQEDAVRVTTTIHLTVEYAGIDRVRLEVPARLADEQVLAFEHEGIVDRAVAVEGERAIVTLTLQGRRTGAFALRCAYPIPLDRFAAGQQKTIVLRPLRVLDCFAQSEELAVKKHANLVIEEEHLERVERRDPRDLPEGLRADGVIQGYRTVAHPSFIALRLTKYDFQAPPDLVIRHLHQAEVVKASGVVEAEAVLAVQNRARQYLRVALPAGAEVRGLNVDGVTGKHTPEDREWRGRPTILIHLGEVTKERREEAFGVRLRYKLAGAGELGAFGRLALEPLAFPLGPEDDAPQAPLGRMTRALYLPSGYAWLGFEGDGARLFDQGGLWSALEWETARAEGSAYQTGQAISALEGLAPRTRAGMYPELDTGSGPPLLFEKADGGMSVAVPYASWGAFYLLDVLLIAAVIALGVLLDRRGVSPALYPCAAAAALVLLGHVIGRPAAVFLAAGVVGAAGLGGVWALRGLARELSARRAERREAERAREAQVTKARAQAAEAEARAQAAAGGESR